MRARNLKPSFFKDEELAELAPQARLLYLGLSCLADFRGVLEDRPLRIRAEILPYDRDADVPEILKQLERVRKIVRFEAGGLGCIFIPGFDRDQNQHKQEREKGTDLPEPPRVRAHTSSDLVRKQFGTDSEPIGLIPDSRSLNTDSRSPSVDVPEIAERMYARHPRKKNKPLVDTECARLYKKHGAAKLAEIDAIHALWCASEDWRRESGRWVPSLDRWLADDGWTQKPAGSGAGAVYRPMKRLGDL